MSQSYDLPIVLERSRLCLKKVAYKSEERAWEVSKKMWRKHGSLLWCFECRFCNQYHLGHPKNPIFLRLLREAAATW